MNAVKLTPTGRLRPTAGALDSAPALGRIIESLETDEGEGLFELAARPVSGGLPPDLDYWRDFASRYLAARCHTPEGSAELPAPRLLPESDKTFLLLSAPPMEGAEYLSAEVLERLWASLDGYVRGEALRSGGLDSLLQKRAPLWRQVGRVCFHLAENKKDPRYPFAFLATYAPRLSKSHTVRYQPLARALQEFAGEGNRKALVSLLSPVQRAAEKSALIKDLVDKNDIYHPLAWTAEDAYGFLNEIPLYEESGVLVRVPDWWAKRPRPRVSVRIGSENRRTLDKDAVLDFKAEVAIGDMALSGKEIRELLAGADGLTYLKGQWVEVDRAKLKEALDHWKRVEEKASSEGISFVEGMRLLAGATADLAETKDDVIEAWSSVHAGDWLGELLRSLRAPQSIEPAAPGKSLHAVLRPYQETGVRWLALLSGLGLGACLADDMGLGKTIQVLALLLSRRRDAKKPSLLVMPASLLANWKYEIERFAPSLKTRFFHPSMAKTATDEESELEGIDVAITTYGMLLRQSWIEEREWSIVVLDEAQAIKNPSTGQTKAVKRIKAEARIAMTGTPVENRLSDLWSLFDFLCPGLLGSAERFTRFAKSLENRPGERYAPLRALVGPYILRRMKTDRSIIADLPEKTEMKVYCGLTKIQAALYKRIVDELAESLDDMQGIKRRGVILSTLLKLKQVCNHPSHFRGDGAWNPGDSGKLARMEELCGEIASRQERALFFTQFREAAEPLASFLASLFGRPGLVLHGGTPVGERRRLVESFQSEDGPPFFVLSLKAGGVGLNLTAASHVVHFDRWWNPAVESQATDRAFRIGQNKNVMVHKLVCRGTVEEKIDALIEEKTALAKDLLEAGGEALLTEMSDERLLTTISLDIERSRVEG